MTTAERGTPGTQRSGKPLLRRATARLRACSASGARSACSRRAAWRRCASSASAELAEGGFEISVSVVDDDNPVARRALREAQSAYDDVITGDLRSAPIPQRTYDVVYCALLLERVHHVELVLDRLVSALKPGGLLLLRTGDRRSAAALLDRLLPGPVRTARLVPVPPRRPRPVPAGLREGGLRRGHRVLRAAARPRHRHPRHRADPPRSSRPGYHRRCESSAPPSPGSPEDASPTATMSCFT